MKGDRSITVNRKAYHDYIITDSMEAGMVLTGTEIKSIRQGGVNIREAYAKPENGELWLLNAHIAQYREGNRYNHEPTRPRKLLLHKNEIRGLTVEVAKKGLTLVPLKMYLKNGRAKVEIGIARGKKLHDKRRSIGQRDNEREIDHVMKSRNR
ncbi:MAG: SsrA-binding protein SmpB [Chloroflexi bacterium]|nr:SsrA-binding protein SmpB [Chloroflexota bacterium]